MNARTYTDRAGIMPLLRSLMDIGSIVIYTHGAPTGA